MTHHPGVALHTADDRAGLNAAWRGAVGGPVALDGEPAHDGADAAGTPDDARPALAVLVWNVWIGRGRLREMLERIRAGAYRQMGVPAGTPLAVLVQEAYRGGDEVPAKPARRTAPHTVLRGGEEDVVATARELGLWLRYAPSMRNGRHRSDRGNAILATLPLLETEAIELPFEYQRRVALSAAVELARPGGGHVRLRLASAHLDPRGIGALDLLGVACRGRQTEALVHHLDRLPREAQLLGADLNLARGIAERAFRRLTAAGFRPGLPEAWPLWSHTYHRWPRLLLDWLLARDPGGTLAGVVVRRLDEQPDDTGLFVFGSDHHPLLARVDLAPA